MRPLAMRLCICRKRSPPSAAMARSTTCLPLPGSAVWAPSASVQNKAAVAPDANTLSTDNRPDFEFFGIGVIRFAQVNGTAAAAQRATLPAAEHGLNLGKHGQSHL